ncbi:MAG: tripartite tricarboxylate transporter substrate binding protein [Betaproteobacteria bacterium]|nr:tripartite tricarboxylate transporter substrate binding protein [Betaproteobacteria bacterium]
MVFKNVAFTALNNGARWAVRGFMLACVAMAGAAHAAENWPTRPVRAIIPFGPGGATDIVTRLLQPSLIEALGQQIVPDNRPGASGNIAAELAARAAPDGYTIFVSNVSVASNNSTLFASTLKTDLDKDLVGVTLLAAIPDVLIVRSDFQPRNLKEMVETMKASPGKFNFGSVLGSYAHLAMLDFNNRAGIKLVHIPVAGGALISVGVLSGEIHYAFTTAAGALPHVKAGRLKTHAALSRQRIPQFADVPTMAESGLPGIESVNWNGFFVPRGTPRAIIDKLHAATLKATQQPQTIAAFEKAAVPLATSRTPEEFQAFVRDESRRWARIIKDNNFKIN